MSSLGPGTRIGPYEIVSSIGAGGMGEVYRARDTRLKRDVAIKILPESFAVDPERLARFQREAEVLASLNHPNIAHVYGLEQADGVQALVMELVEGPTLADRIAQGPIPVDEALPIAKQIAEALEAAHEQGIIHRDLKPANIKITPNGDVKVLDFGLAKALEPVGATGRDATLSPTITSPAMITGVGVLLGTAAYMSPEQARGKAVDKRSDIWAFGCVLYEMLTGRRAFEGEDVADTLASVLKAEPNWSALPPEVPVSIRTLLAGCLAKDRRQRIADVSVALFVIDHHRTIESSGIGAPVSATRESRLRTALLASAVVVVGLATGYGAWMLKPAAPRGVTRFTITLPMGDRFSNLGVHAVALSADGNRLAYTANGRVYIRTMDQLAATPLRGTESANASVQPFFSPDGEWVGFWQGGQLKKVSRTGGAPVVLCSAENPWGATWTTDNAILYGQGQRGPEGIWRVSSNGGKPERLVKVEPGQIAQGPQLLPGGHAILFTLVTAGDWDRAQIVVQSLDTGQRHVVLEPGADARYLPTGHLVYALQGTLFAVPFDVTMLAVTGGAVPLVEDILQGSVAAQFATSSQGALVYVPRDAVLPPGTRQRVLVWVDRQGGEVPIKAPPRVYNNPRLSPDGTRVALDVRDQEHDIWIWDLAREVLTRLTIGPATEQYAIWTPDGRDVIFSSSKLSNPGPNLPRTLFRRRSDGTGTIEQLTQGSIAQFPSTVTPDGNALIFRELTSPPTLGTPPGWDLVLLPLGAEHRARRLLQTPFNELNAEVSPDGHWLAYQSNESGREEVYVRPFPNVDAGKWQVSTSGGTQPLWARNGRELFYVSTNTLMRVPLTSSSIFQAGTPSKLFGAAYLLTLPPGEGAGRMYDASRDGQRFLVMKDSNESEAEPSARIILVQNWFEELKRLVPTK
jgi:eukaryotic-like serine/threonine-protein kinase